MKKNINNEVVATDSLHEAVKTKNIDTVKKFFEDHKDLDVNARDDDGNTALHHAVKQELLGVIKILLEKGARTYIANNQKKTPRILANDCVNKKIKAELVKVGKEEILREQSVIQESLKINNFDEFDVLHVAVEFRYAKEGQIKDLAYLSDTELNDLLDKNQSSLIHWAVYGNQENMVDFLMKKQITLDPNKLLHTPLYIAAKKYPALFEKMLTNLKTHYSVEAIINYISVFLINCCKYNDAAILKYFLATNLHRQTLTSEELIQYALNTILYNGILKNNLEITELAINYGADVNSYYYNGQTALHEAVLQDNLTLVRLLLQHSANPKQSASDEFEGPKMTPLQMAQKFTSLKNQQEIILALSMAQPSKSHIVIPQGNSNDKINNTSIHGFVSKKENPENPHPRKKIKKKKISKALPNVEPLASIEIFKKLFGKKHDQVDFVAIDHSTLSLTFPSVHIAQEILKIFKGQLAAVLTSINENVINVQNYDTLEANELLKFSVFFELGWNKDHEIIENTHKQLQLHRFKDLFTFEHLQTILTEELNILVIKFQFLSPFNDLNYRKNLLELIQQFNKELNTKSTSHQILSFYSDLTITVSDYSSIAAIDFDSLKISFSNKFTKMMNSIQAEKKQALLEQNTDTLTLSKKTEVKAKRAEEKRKKKEERKLSRKPKLSKSLDSSGDESSDSSGSASSIDEISESSSNRASSSDESSQPSSELVFICNNNNQSLPNFSPKPLFEEKFTKVENSITKDLLTKAKQHYNALNSIQKKLRDFTSVQITIQYDFATLFHAVCFSEISAQIFENTCPNARFTQGAIEVRDILADRPDFFLPDNTLSFSNYMYGNNSFFEINKIIFTPIFKPNSNEIKIQADYSQINFYKNFDNDAKLNKHKIPNQLKDSKILLETMKIVVNQFLNMQISSVDLQNDRKHKSTTLSACLGAIFLLGHYARIMRDHCSDSFTLELLINNNAQLNTNTSNKTFNHNIMENDQTKSILSLDFLKNNDENSNVTSDGLKDLLLLLIKMRNRIAHNKTLPVKQVIDVEINLRSFFKKLDNYIVTPPLKNEPSITTFRNTFFQPTSNSPINNTTASMESLEATGSELALPTEGEEEHAQTNSNV